MAATRCELQSPRRKEARHCEMPGFLIQESVRPCGGDPIPTELWRIDFRKFRFSSVVDAGFQEASEFMEVTAWWNKANNGHQCGRIDQLVKRHIVQVQLS